MLKIILLFLLELILESKFPDLFDPNSPTKRVGDDLTKSFETVQYQYLCFFSQ